MLQWGRDLTVADSLTCPAGVALYTALQWGRDLTVADSSSQGAKLSKGWAASMGPRPDGRG